MTKPVTLSINIPFCGFYDSLLSGELDHCEERNAEWYAERQEEEGIPEDLRLDQSEFAQILYDVSSYDIAHQYIANRYVSAFEDYCADELGMRIPFGFEEMTSPKEYNFETDRIFCTIPVKHVLGLMALSRKDKHVRLAAMIKDRFTSRSGFISHYSNRLSDWLEKPVKDWDHNELGTLLLALLPTDEDRGETLDWKIYYRLTDGECFDTALDRAVDWAKFEEKVSELREEKADELRAEDPDYVAPPMRCDRTMELPF